MRAILMRVLTFEDLRRLCAPEGPPPRTATVVRWARSQGIRFKYDGRGGIWTTMEALNAALGLQAQGDDEQDTKELI